MNLFHAHQPLGDNRPMPRTLPPEFDDLQTRDRHRLRSAWRRAKNDAQAQNVVAEASRSAATTQQRRDAVPRITLNDALPVSQAADDIAAALAESQVLVVTGDTGSGKTTQLPKILLQAGFGARGLIGHTQPRRLAARSVAQRIADEVGRPLGDLVGFQTRFDKQLGEATQVKLMTDGILLAETTRDRYLSAYEAIIVDEAHERSLNIDFLLGYLKRLLPQRPDLKLIITSATIDPQRFADFFDDAPMLHAEGRSYPVEQRYVPLDDDDLPAAIFNAAHGLWREAAGDILVFLPGERDIRDTESHLRKALSRTKFSAAEILPLYARLTRSAQDAIFKPSRGRRIVLATNVAETSLTVPGIRYVIDSGLARVSRYSTTAKIQRLPIEPVSQAACAQRAGRCGREAPGICVRLFDADDFEARPAFTDPEIRRTNLASVLLTMADLRLGDIADFPFIDAPEHRAVRDGVRLLQQLGAMRDDDRITKLGRQLARLPLDPRIGRMLLAGNDQTTPALRIICAGLSIQDPRERPSGQREAADTAQADFADSGSDFIAMLKLWDAWQAQKRAGGGSALRKWARKHFLNFMRLREWEDLVRQLRQLAPSTQRPPKRLTDTPPDAVHQAILFGLLDHIGLHDERGDYLGARGRRFRIFPGSGIAKKPPRWIVAAELIETSRLFAHRAAAVQPEWIEAAAGSLLSREHYNPAWHKRRGQVLASERVKLFGLPLADDRKVDFGRIDAEAARTLFIEQGLVPGEVVDARGKLPEFLAANQQVIADIAAREARFRRRDLLVDAHTQARAYDAVLPADVFDRKSLQRWLQANDDTPLRFDEDMLLRHAGLSLPEDAFPETLLLGQTPLALHYHFEPGHEADGVTLAVPLPMLNQLDAASGQWLVPGLREELVREHIKALPKALRRNFVPAPDFAQAAVERLGDKSGRFAVALRDALEAIGGVQLPPDCWADFAPSPHLQMRYAVIDDGKQIAAGRDLAALQAQFGKQARQAVAAVPDSQWAQTDLRDWPERDLPASVTIKHQDVQVEAVPCLIDRGTHVDLQLVEDPARALRSHRDGVMRLLMLQAKQPLRFLKRELDDFNKLAALPLPDPPEAAAADDDVTRWIAASEQPALLAELAWCVAQDQLGATALQARSADDFAALSQQFGRALAQHGPATWKHMRSALKLAVDMRKRLGRSIPPPWMPAITELRSQLDTLLHTGGFANAPAPKHLTRYLQAMVARLDGLKANAVAKDTATAKLVAPHWQRYVDRLGKAGQHDKLDALRGYRWMVEEYRVQCFAQTLGTAQKVSPKRLDAAWDALRRSG